MIIETSTVNILLAAGITAIIALQAWIVKELIALKVKITAIAAQCPFCGARVTHQKK